MTQKHYHRILLWILFLGIVFTAGFSFFYLQNMIPDQVHVTRGEMEEVSFLMFPAVTIDSESREVMLGMESDIPRDQIRISNRILSNPYHSFYICSEKQGSYRLNMKLFGTIPVKQIQVNVSNERYAMPCGVPVGIYLKSKGIMVIGTGQITDQSGQTKDPAEGVLLSGDYIESFNAQPLEDKEALITQLNASGASEVLLKVRRGGELMDIHMKPVQADSGDFKLGAWVRDDTQGIGTLTYMDQNGGFGALGHGISDIDTGRLVEISEGALYETQIVGIEKGARGTPGVMAGVIYYGPGSLLGEINTNTSTGVTGKANGRLRSKLQTKAIPIGYRQEIHKGQAWIRSSISGELKDYEIEIQRVEYTPLNRNKGLIIHVTDPELLSLTGGIIQGMSGSPIIQDGKLVGAVTHVFINDPTRGYGIFAEEMMTEQ